MENSRSGIERQASRRSFLRTGTWGVGAAVGTDLLNLLSRTLDCKIRRLKINVYRFKTPR